MHNLVIRALCTALVLSLAACGGGGSTPPPANTTPVITEGTSTSVNMSVNSMPTAFSLTLNATDADNDTLTWSVSSAATHGSASASGTGTSKGVSYTPNTNYVGGDSFDVQVSDGNGGTDFITVNVTVSNNNPVIAQGASTDVSMSENGTPTAFSLTLGASDMNGDTLTWSLSAVANHGTASASGTGTSPVLGYTPDTDYIGTDSFDVQVADGHGGTATITVNVTITTTNTVTINVDAGVSGYTTYNRPFVSVKICEPGTTTCQTIDHIVVDTGSMGLRILSSAVSLSLPEYNDTFSASPSNTVIGECYPLVGGYMWGTLRTATVQMGGEVTASPVPIQVINDIAVAAAPSGCTAIGANMGSLAAIKANGILGVGYFKQDCGTKCESVSNNVYFTCTDSTNPNTCSSPGIPATNQVPNPVTMFGLNGSGVSDNNGVTVSLPAVDLTGANNLTGTLTFGINSQPNNQLGSVQVFTVDNPTGLLPTQFNGQTLCNSAIDTGSNNLNFPQGSTGMGNTFDTPSLCGDNTFYCPASGTYPSFSATIVGLNSTSVQVDFYVTDPGPLSGTAFNDIAAKLNTFAATPIPGCTGSNQTAGSFIWGLPFFFGRDVSVVFDGETVDSNTGPFIAF